MRFEFAFLSLCILMACNTGGPGFRGVPAVTRSVDDSTFLIRVARPMAEATRTSPEMLPRFGVVARRAAQAVEQESGCSVAWIQGDPAMMVLGLSCDGAKPPRKPKRKARFSCDATNVTYSKSRKAGSGILRCYPD